MKNGLRAARIEAILSMAIFGTIGIFRHYMPFASGLLAMVRGLAGAGLLALFCRVTKRTAPYRITGRARLLLPLSGAMIGFNWILLFEAYRYTTVATATLCYYMAPVLVMLASPLLLHERLTPRKAVCVALAVIGMALVSGITAGDAADTQLIGVLLGLGAAVLYAASMMLNKKLGDVPAETRTVLQLLSAGTVLVPYVLLAERGAALPAGALPWILLAVVCAVHTALAYLMYFSALRTLPAQSVAVLSYIDPVLAVLLSLLLLREPMTAAQAAGAVLLLGAMLLSELSGKKRKE